LNSGYLSPIQSKRHEEFRSFTQQAIAPHAARIDMEQQMPRHVIEALAEQGYLGAMLAADRGGRAMGVVEYGLLTEEIGRSCQSVRNLVAVVDMVARSIDRWGTRTQWERWLPPIITGQSLAAFALTEPGVGSDAAAVTTTATREAEEIVLNGVKKWISFAQIADLYLVFAQYQGGPTGFLVERQTQGLSVEPITGVLGLRGSMLGQITLERCRVPLANMVGRPGTGVTFVASDALDLGRYSTAWGSVGLAEECLTVAADYAARRVQYGTEIMNHQLVRQLLADMATETLAARLLCHHAGLAKEHGAFDVISPTLMAKYHASKTAVLAASNAVQILGAQGVSADSPVERFYRDAKVLEIIEGTSQIQQMLIGQAVSQAGPQ
jgi:glutaryl-CoA dehydrogenase (non-decarboxylating)